MDGNEKEKPPDEADGNSNVGMDIDNNTRKRNLQTLGLSPVGSPQEPAPKKITIHVHKEISDQVATVCENVVIPHVDKQPDENAANPLLYKHPDLSTEARGYNADDDGPFVVHISKESSADSKSSLKAIYVGMLLTQANVTNIKKDGIKSVGRNRVSVTFDKAADANSILKNPMLDKYKLSANIPTYNISRMGLVRGVPTDWSMTDFVKGTNLEEGKGRILKARRLQRKVTKEDGSPSWVPTQTVVVTFEGQSLPSRIFAYYTSLVVEVYQLPTIQCRKCLRFGHIQTQCRSDARCYKCAQKHPGDGCNVAPEHISCIFCTARHYATDRNCPEHHRQKSIKLIMSERNISYAEAAAQVPVVNRRPYADVANIMFGPTRESPPPSQSPFDPTDLPSTPPRTSHRKTVFLSPRPRPSLSPGYDRQAHNNIVRPPPSEIPNGQALNNPYTRVTPNEDLMELLLKLLTNIIAKWSDCLPNDVAPLMLTLVEKLSFPNGPPGHLSTME